MTPRTALEAQILATATRGDQEAFTTLARSLPGGLERYTVAELVDLAEAIWGPRARNAKGETSA